MNIAELNDLDEDTRLELEGFRTGTYLRLEVHNVPYEMVEHFDPYHPILVGGVGLGEENVGYMQVSGTFQSIAPCKVQVEIDVKNLF
jgi:ribosome biogenesis protein BMS1